MEKGVTWEEMEDILDKIGPKEGLAMFQSELICSHTIKDDFRLAGEGYIFLGVLKEDHIIKQEIHVWGKNEQIRNSM